MNARSKSKFIHSSGDIKSAGNEVEDAVRVYLKRMLPSKYYVTHGHLIDVHGDISPQIDVIIADNEKLPSLLTTRDGTEYIPTTSTYAVGEVKSTYYKSKKYIEEFCNSKRVVNGLSRPKIKNTAFGKIDGNTNIEHLLVGNSNMHLNNLFSFMIFIDSGDFDFKDIAEYIRNKPLEEMPSMIVILGSGVILYAKIDENGLGFHKYPHEAGSEYEWCFTPMRADEIQPSAGKHLGSLYRSLISHLSISHLEPLSADDMLKDMSVARRSELVRASDITK